jgi:serine/threonine-protein kinase
VAPRIVGHYRLLSLIGKGATSEVYAAEHALLGDKVAVKLLRRELADDPGQTQALVEEGARVRGIDHANVGRVLDVGVDSATAGCYLVMEHIRGETLAARIREGALPEADVRRLGAAIADGVAAAHARGIIHRDLKPANIMLDGDQPKIVDFGIAKHLGSRSAVTTGRMIGTLAYMAPEQFASGMIAPCTDIWALGTIVFELVTGRLPFENFDDGRCPQIFDEPRRASSLVEVSPALDMILARCLSREPARRPASAEELAKLLRGAIVLDDERMTVDAGPIAIAAAAPSLAPAALVRRATGRYRVAAIAAACAVVVFVVAVTRGANDTSRAATIAADREGDRAVTIDPVVVDETPVDADAIKIEIDEPIVETPVVETPEAPAMKQVTIQSRPSRAEVYVGGVRRGITPLTLGLPPGEKIVLRRDGYLPAIARFERKGPIEVTLRKKKKSAPPDPPIRKETLR